MSLAQVTQVSEGDTRQMGEETVPIIVLEASDRTYHMCASTVAEHKEWMECLEEGLAEAQPSKFKHKPRSTSTSGDGASAPGKDDAGATSKAGDKGEAPKDETDGMYDRWNVLLDEAQKQPHAFSAVMAKFDEAFRHYMHSNTNQGLLKATQKLEGLRVMHSCVTSLATNLHDALRTGIISSLFPILREPTGDNLQLLKSTVAVAKNERMLKRIETEVDDCITDIVKDEVLDIEDVDNIEEVLKVCDGVVDRLHTVHTEVKPLMPREFNVMATYCNATHKGVLERLIDRIITVGERNVVTEDALKLLTWSVSFQDTLHHYHPTLEVSPRLRALTDEFYRRYHVLLEQTINKWVRHVSALVCVCGMCTGRVCDLASRFACSVVLYICACECCRVLLCSLGFDMWQFVRCIPCTDRRAGCYGDAGALQPQPQRRVGHGELHPEANRTLCHLVARGLVPDRWHADEPGYRKAFGSLPG